MKNGSDADGRKDSNNIAIITPLIKPEPFDMTLMDDTPFETPQYEQSIVLIYQVESIVNLILKNKKKLTSLMNNNSTLKTSKKKQISI